MSKETIEEPMNTIINKDAEDEFYDANDIVELVENKFGKMNLDKERLSDENPSDKDEDFQSLPPINTRVSHLKELEEKVKELEKEDERINEEKEENDDKEYSDEEYEENNAVRRTIIIEIFNKIFKIVIILGFAIARKIK